MNRLRDAWLVLTGRWFAVDPDSEVGRWVIRNTDSLGNYWPSPTDDWQYNGTDEDGTTHYVSTQGHLTCSPGVRLG